MMISMFDKMCKHHPEVELTVNAVGLGRAAGVFFGAGGDCLAEGYDRKVDQVARDFNPKRWFMAGSWASIQGWLLR